MAFVLILDNLLVKLHLDLVATQKLASETDAVATKTLFGIVKDDAESLRMTLGQENCGRAQR